MTGIQLNREEYLAWRKDMAKKFEALTSDELILLLAEVRDSHASKLSAPGSESHCNSAADSQLWNSVVDQYGSESTPFETSVFETVIKSEAGIDQAADVPFFGSYSDRLRQQHLARLFVKDQNDIPSTQVFTYRTFL